MQCCIVIYHTEGIYHHHYVQSKGTNMLGIRTMSCLSHYPTAASIDKLLSVSCSRPRPKGTNPFFLASVLAGNDVWWRWWSLKLGGGFQVLEGQIL